MGDEPQPEDKGQEAQQVDVLQFALAPLTEQLHDTDELQEPQERSGAYMKKSSKGMVARRSHVNQWVR